MFNRVQKQMQVALSAMLLMLGWQLQAADINQQALLANQMSATPYVIVDVRSPEEFAEGHLKGAINIPHDQTDAYQTQLEALKGKPLVVYCRSGRRASMFEQLLTPKGYEILHLEGDVQAWQAAELPLIK
ncbi:rhodanese-like domain-containing protein [Pseudoalteromonas fenneropenaei]|uniref:Rhodanese-like domain-containing protein n=1 Tax=Pseudoalteromonas fenneropenaei TaxID=1737459 RepID=A0ABV7CGN7_9GAMM